MSDQTVIDSHGADEEPAAGYEREFIGAGGWLFATLCGIYAAWHLYVLNIAPMETISFRMAHVLGALVLGYALAMAAPGREAARVGGVSGALAALALLICLVPLAMTLYAWGGWLGAGIKTPAPFVFQYFGPLLAGGVALAMLSGWLSPAQPNRVPLSDWALIAASLAVGIYLLFALDNLSLRLRAGTAFADPQNGWAAAVGVALILELTRRVAGAALVVIAGIFVAYAFVGPWLPGFLNHSGYDAKRFFSYVYTDNGVLGPTIAVSSTYIILFIIFAAFLSASKVGDYFVNFAFAAAGHARGGPAKVAVFASGLMGMINGTSAGNVVATGSLTIPMMKRVGYRPQTAAAVEAAASTGGQIMPPIMGAGAFIMAEITGIPYTELVIAAIIPAVIYFLTIYFTVDLEAQKRGMAGLPREMLPKFGALLRQVYLFIPVIILIYALFAGYSVIRAGTLATVAAMVVSWLTPHAMGPRAIGHGLALASRMSIQIIAVCACAGVIVGVIALTGVGARFSSLLLALAENSQLLALIFAMVISVILGMGMPTTAAYAVAASVVAPGLVQLGIPPLIAHFFVFYFAVVSAITPPVALAAYAGAAIAGSEPMRTSVEAFKVGLAAFIVPFMFFYSHGLLMEGDTLTIARNCASALVGVYFLSAAVVGWLRGAEHWLIRLGCLAVALLLIHGALISDAAGVALGAALWLLSPRLARG